MFKLMATEMTDKEVRICMSLLFDGVEIQLITRERQANSINVEFVFMNDAECKMYSVYLLPDSIDELSPGVDIKPGGEYVYKQFMVAKGYSEYWKDNIFI